MSIRQGSGATWIPDIASYVQGLTGKSRQFFLVAKILICQEMSNIKLSNFVSLLRIQMRQIFHTIWPPLANMRFSKGVQNMETPWVISAISSDLTAFLMSSLRAVMLLREL